MVVNIKYFNTELYQETLAKMQEFTKNRDKDTIDEFWVLEHFPVFTQGQAGKPEHLLKSTNIPVIQSDRGGQITYHAPGQLIIYLLCNLKNKKMSVHDFVKNIEQSIIDLLNNINIQSHRIKNAPGIYVENSKIAQLGLRVKKGCTYHGLSLNINLDLSPFLQINPCGYKDLKVTKIETLAPNADLSKIPNQLCKYLMNNLNYSKINEMREI